MQRIATLAIAVGLASSAAHGAIYYEPFDYPAGNLGLNVNPSTGLPWYSSVSSGTEDRVQVGGESLAVEGMPAGIGGSASFGGAGRTDRLAFGPNLNSGSVYYSLMLNVTDLAQTLATGATIAGFNNTQQSAANHDTAGQPTAISGRLILKPVEGSTTTYQLGASKAAGTLANFVFTDALSPYAVGETVFIVGRYTFNAGSSTDDVFDLWVNPPSGTFADDALIPAPTLTTNLGGDGGQIATFILRQFTGVVPAGLVVDELRVDRTWAHVTSNLIPEPSAPALLALAVTGWLARRRAR